MDDTQFCLSLHCSAMDPVLSLEHCLDAVLGWMRDNRLMLSPEKMEVLQVGASLSFGGGYSFH